MISGRKPANLWILVGITYGAVAVVAILALVGYHYMSSGKEEPERAGNIAVGTVWITMYPGAVVHDTAASRHGEIAEGTLKFGSGDPPATVLAFYRDTLHKSGFQLEANAGERSVRAVGRAGKVEVVVTADPQGPGSEVQIATVDHRKK